MRGSSRPLIQIFYGPIRSTNNMSHGMASAFISVNLPHYNFVSCFSDKSYIPNVGTYVVP